MATPVEAVAERGIVVVVDAPPEAAAHLRHRLHDAGVDVLPVAVWPPTTHPARIAAVVAWTDDVVGTVGAVRRLTAAPLLLIAATLPAAAWADALDNGADGCLGAATPAAVIAAQLRALVRARPHTVPTTSTRLSCGRVSLDLTTRRVQVGADDIKLNRREFDLLAHLMEHRERVHHRHELLSAVWGSNFMGDSNTIDVHIAWLRQKLAPDAGMRITTIRGLGYRLDEL